MLLAVFKQCQRDRGMSDGSKSLPPASSGLSVDHKIAGSFVKMDMALAGEIPGAQYGFNLQGKSVRDGIGNAGCDLLLLFGLLLDLQQRFLSLLQLGPAVLEVDTLLNAGALLHQ